MRMLRLSVVLLVTGLFLHAGAGVASAVDALPNPDEEKKPEAPKLDAIKVDFKNKRIEIS